LSLSDSVFHCSAPKFICHINSIQTCQPPEKRCDGTPDCDSGTDENGKCEGNYNLQWNLCTVKWMMLVQSMISLIF